MYNFSVGMPIQQESKSGLHYHNYDLRSMHIMQKMCSVVIVLSCRPIGLNVDYVAISDNKCDDVKR